MRKTLARLRTPIARKGVDLRPFTHPASGRYAGFALTWKGDPDRVLRGAIANVAHGEHTVRFFVDDERDHIQKDHVLGRFYEREKLAIIARYFAGGTFVDVGANVGNHAVFAGAILGASWVIAFEPNPRARRVLEINLALNGLSQQSVVHAMGLSDKSGTAAMAELAPNNLGSARIAERGPGAPIDLVEGDSLLLETRVDFLKIDVEGHELQVLHGLAGSLRRSKPVVFIEIEEATSEPVWAFFDALGYRADERFARYEGRENVVFLPRDSVGPLLSAQES